MSPSPTTAHPGIRPFGGLVHVIGAGPVGLMTAALLQPIEGLSVHLYEKRGEYTRTRMVQLAPYLMADSVETYQADAIDSDSIAALFDPGDLAQGIAFRQSLPADLSALLREWSLGFCALNEIERSLSDLIDARAANPVQRTSGVVTAEDAIAMLEPGSIVIDCTGSNSILRDHLTTGVDDVAMRANTVKVRLEYALVITFLYGQPYDCNEYCKYYKNIDNPHYKFIPMVHRTHYDGSVSHVTGIVNITAEEFEAMPSRFDGQWLRGNFPGVADSMDNFIEKIKQETHGEVIGDFEIVRIPLDLYRARNATNRQWLRAGAPDHPLADATVFLAGDSAIGSPYFQSISLGFECAMKLADTLARPDLPLDELLDRYELFMYQQWLRVYMRSKMIKHNKDLFESLDDSYRLLEQLHIY
jgi:2-polyprenyl-6-methoxyphenol hydroxylase-like FAD-dependent oxidoreductase